MNFLLKKGAKSNLVPRAFPLKKGKALGTRLSQIMVARTGRRTGAR